MNELTTEQLEEIRQWQNETPRAIQRASANRHIDALFEHIAALQGKLTEVEARVAKCEVLEVERLRKALSGKDRNTMSELLQVKARTDV